MTDTPQSCICAEGYTMVNGDCVRCDGFDPYCTGCSDDGFGTLTCDGCDSTKLELVKADGSLSCEEPIPHC